MTKKLANIGKKNIIQTLIVCTCMHALSSCENMKVNLKFLMTQTLGPLSPRIRLTDCSKLQLTEAF